MFPSKQKDNCSFFVVQIFGYSAFGHLFSLFYFFGQCCEFNLFVEGSFQKFLFLACSTRVSYGMAIGLKVIMKVILLTHIVC